MKVTYLDFIKMNESKSIISLSDIDKLIKNIFIDTKVESVNTLYEKYSDGYKLVISINNIFYDTTNIIHTKLIFYTDNKKNKINKNHFLYLYDINCNFKEVYFDDIDDLQSKINDIFNKRRFGRDVKILSDLTITMTENVNKWLNDNNLNKNSIYNISYEPLTDVIPCESLFFKFTVNINDTKFIKMSIRKIANNDYKISFNENEWFEDYDIVSLNAIPQTIGNMIKKHIK
jgi:hypothetical protein